MFEKIELYDGGIIFFNINNVTSIIKINIDNKDNWFINYDGKKLPLLNKPEKLLKHFIYIGNGIYLNKDKIIYISIFENEILFYINDNEKIILDKKLVDQNNLSKLIKK